MFGHRKLFLDLAPAKLMSPSEVKEVSSLLVASDRSDPLFEQRSQRLAQLGGAVLFRHLGVERYMVLEVERDDGHRVRMQLIDVHIEGAEYEWGWKWWLSGRALRKDATLGSLPEGICYSSARISCRLLTGEWRRMAPKSVRTKERYASRP